MAMTIQYYPNGIGGTVGDSLDTCKPLQTSGNVWYVSSLIGTDAVSPAGQNREKPLATVAQAVTNAADEDIIVFLQGHTQTLLATQNVAKRLTFIGEGTTGGKPGVSFTPGAAVALFSVSVAAVEFRNIYIKESAVANTFSKIIYINATDGVIRGCYFECGANDQGAALTNSASSRMRVESSTFIATGTSTAAQPFTAFFVTGSITGMVLKDVVVSAGQYGYSNYAAIDCSAAGPLTQLRMEGLSLLLGADMVLPAAATGRVNIQTATGGSRVVWS